MVLASTSHLSWKLYREKGAVLIHAYVAVARDVVSDFFVWQFTGIWEVIIALSIMISDFTILTRTYVHENLKRFGPLLHCMLNKYI